MCVPPYGRALLPTGALGVRSALWSGITAYRRPRCVFYSSIGHYCLMAPALTDPPKDRALTPTGAPAVYPAKGPGATVYRRPRCVARPSAGATACWRPSCVFRSRIGHHCLLALLICTPLKDRALLPAGAPAARPT